MQIHENGRYGNQSGTSMSCPLVAGVVGLVMTQHPTWSGMRAAEQVRATADNIDSRNPNFTGLLGKGRLNSSQAVSKNTPSIRISNVAFSESNGDGVIQPGESVEVELTLKNFLSPATNVSLRLTTDDSLISLTNASATVAAIGTMEEITPPNRFRFKVADNSPSGHRADFTLHLASSNYADLDHFGLTVRPTFVNLSANNVSTTATNIGRIGAADTGDLESGIGFRFQEGRNLLFEGAIIAGAGPAQISNAARGRLINGSQISDEDFTIAAGGDLQIRTPGLLSDQETVGIFEDGASDKPMNIRVTQETFARTDPPFDDLVIWRYTIENRGSQTLDNFHFGLFFDWDIDDTNNNWLTNKAGYDAERKLGYAFDTGNGPDTYVGASVLSEGGVSFRAIYNDPNHTSNPSWGLHDGFTDAEKWEAISSGISIPAAGPADISFVIAVGPFSIEAEASIEIGFASLAGNDLSDLRANAESARQMWREIVATSVEDNNSPDLPTAFSLEPNFPNPFNPSTEISFQLPRASRVTIEVYDLLGRRVLTLIDKLQPAGRHTVRWNGTNESGALVQSGVYLYRMATAGFVQTHKMLLVK